VHEDDGRHARVVGILQEVDDALEAEENPTAGTCWPRKRPIIPS
jgi:hypothetical protein